MGLLFGPAFTSVAERDAALGSFVTDTLFPGMTDLFNKETPRAELEWWVCYMLAVLPRHQGKGIGSMLLQHRVEHSSGVPMMLNTQTEHNVGVMEWWWRLTVARLRYTRRTGTRSAPRRSTRCRTASLIMTGSCPTRPMQRRPCPRQRLSPPPRWPREVAAAEVRMVVEGIGCWPR